MSDLRYGETCRERGMEYDMIAKLFSSPPPSPTFTGKFFRCHFHYPKMPLEAGAPPTPFDASYQSYAPGSKEHENIVIFINTAMPMILVLFT